MIDDEPHNRTVDKMAPITSAIWLPSEGSAGRVGAIHSHHVFLHTISQKLPKVAVVTF
jgi:hypothetical protein